MGPAMVGARLQRHIWVISVRLKATVRLKADTTVAVTPLD